MIHNTLLRGLALGIALLFSGSVIAQQEYNDTEQLIEQIVQDVVDYNLERAREKVQKHTGIDPLRRGFEWEKDDSDYPSVSRDIADERRSELQRLVAEHDREMAKYERELEREVSKARREFSREAAREERRDKIMEKRRKLEKKSTTPTPASRKRLGRPIGDMTSAGAS